MAEKDKKKMKKKFKGRNAHKPNSNKYNWKKNVKKEQGIRRIEKRQKSFVLPFVIVNASLKDAVNRIHIHKYILKDWKQIVNDKEI